jgi:Tol biopolymer transport system component
MSWSPDGKLLAFISGRGGYEAVHVVRADGTQTIRLTAQASLDPNWSHP